MMSLQKTKRMEAMMRRKKAMTSRRRYWYLKDGIKININKDDIKININKDDIKGKVFLPGKFHCRTFHPSVMRMSKQIFQPPH